MNKITILTITLACLGLSACATPIPQEKIENADYGSPPPENYQDLIKTNISRELIDPTAPIFEFGKPAKGYIKHSDLFETSEMFGWRVCGTVNSKNRLGGYVGAVPYIVLFKNGRIAQQVIGESAGTRNGFSIANIGIKEACQR